MRIPVIAALVALAACPALAGWEHWGAPNRRYEMAAQARTAAYERCYAVGVNPSTNATWAARVALAFERGKLVAVKSMVQSVRPYYIRPACFNGGTTLDAYCATGTMASVVYTNDAQLLTDAGAPANWFTSTPWIGLDAHSNGWRYVPAVFSNLTAALFGGAGAWATNEYDSSGYGYGATWAAAVADMDWLNLNFLIQLPRGRAYFGGGIQYDGQRFAGAHRDNMHYIAPTNAVLSELDAYHKAGLMGGTITEFDDNGDGVTTNWTRWEAFSARVGNATSCVGSVAISVLPNECAEPTVTNSVEAGTAFTSLRGWGPAETDIPLQGRDNNDLLRNLPVLWVRRFNVAGGFEY